jgi:sulfur carrier protein ThiS
MGKASASRGGGTGVTVTVVLFGMHRALLPYGARQKGRIVLRYDAESVTPAQLMRDLAMPADQAGIVLLDGNPIGPDHSLADGDTVSFVAPVSGG